MALNETPRQASALSIENCRDEFHKNGLHDLFSSNSFEMMLYLLPVEQMSSPTWHVPIYLHQKRIHSIHVFRLSFSYRRSIGRPGHHTQLIFGNKMAVFHS